MAWRNVVVISTSASDAEEEPDGDGAAAAQSFNVPEGGAGGPLAVAEGAAGSSVDGSDDGLAGLSHWDISPNSGWTVDDENVVRYPRTELSETPSHTSVIGGEEAQVNSTRPRR